MHSPQLKRPAFPMLNLPKRLLKEQRVAVVPGSVFGAGGEDHLRCAYAVSRKDLNTALRKNGRVH